MVHEVDEFGTDEEESELVSVQDENEEEFGLENQEWVFKHYGQL